MAGRDSDSYIFRKGVTPNTLSVISSKNRVFAYDSLGQKKQIGVMATFDPSESRTVEPVRGIGFGDHIAELVPGVTDPMTISVTRTALYMMNIMQVFGYKAGIDGITRSLKHHRWPFDVQQEIVFSQIAKNAIGGSISDAGGAAGSNITGPTNYQDKGPGLSDSIGEIGLLTLYEACWLSDYSVSYASDSAIVQESVTINVSDILAGTGLDSFYNTEEPFSALNSGLAMSNRLR
jgi:hypothetical protein